MQQTVVALVVALAVALLAIKGWRAVRRRCRPKGQGSGCDKCCKCG